MNKRGVWGVHAGVAVVAASGIFAAVGDAGAARSAANVTIGINDSALLFAPNEVTITVGDSVTWDFTGSTASHNAASENTSADDPSWETYDTGFKNSGQSAPRQFTAVGEYDFICQAHPATMKGKITVVEGTTTPPTRTPGPIITPTATVAAATPAPTVDHSRDTPAPTGRAAADKTAPTVSKLTARGAGASGARVKWTLSEAAQLTFTVHRTSSRKVLRTVRISGLPGSSALTIRGSRLKPGRYFVWIEARDAAGNRSQPTRVVVRIGR